MKKIGLVLLTVVLVVSISSSRADAHHGGFHGGFRGHHFHGGFHGHRFHHFHGGAFFFGVGVGAVLTAPFWYPPAYAYPAYTPVYTYPTYAPAYVTVPANPPLGPPQVSVQTCQTVWVEGHYETRVGPTGQPVTAWVPTHRQQICQ